MHLFLFINYIGGVSQKKKKNYIGGSSIKKKIYIGGSLVIFVKGIFIINLKKLFGKKLIGIYGIFTQETCNSTGTSWYFQI